jgi:hypothetical protein
MKSPRIHLSKIAVGIVVAVLMLTTALIVYIVRLETKDYPGVEISGSPVLIGDQTIPQGGELNFVRDSVCVPAGKTLVKRWAQRDPASFQGVEITNSFDVGQFTIDASAPVCFAPSRTTILLPFNIEPGKYVIRLETTVESPNGPVETTSYSPPFIITKAEPLFSSDERAQARKALDEVAGSN